MNRIITLLLTIVLTSITFNTHSQNKAKTPCTSKEYKQFDFWLGNWKVYDVKNNLIGENSIVKMPNACAMQENWDSAQGPSKGTSYNYYNAQDKSWNQLWIDNAGGSLALKGKRINNKMILKSNLIKSEKGDFYNKITWTHNPDGTVTQLWELVSENGKVLSESFRGIYKKVLE